MIFVPKFGVPKKHRDPVVLWRSTANVNRKGLGCGKTLWQHKNRLVFAQPSRRPKGTSKQIWCRSYVKPTTYGQPAARETANQSRYHKGDAHPRALRLQLGHVEVTGSIRSCLGMNVRPWNTEIESENGSSHIICTAIEWSLPNDLARRTSTDNVNMSKWAREAKLPGSQTSRLFSKKSNRSVFEHRNHWWLTIHNQLYIAVNLLTVNHLPKRSIWKKIGIFGLLAALSPLSSSQCTKANSVIWMPNSNNGNRCFGYSLPKSLHLVPAFCGVSLATGGECVIRPW